jgi:dihydrodipicolinate synthase/N-acetylneuraminate lyase
MIYDQGVRGELSIEDELAPLVRDCSNIVAAKVSSEPDRIIELKDLVDVSALCGWDMMSLIAYQNGADGVISGFAGVFPEYEVEISRAVKSGQWDKAREIFYRDCLPPLLHLTFDPYAFSAGKYILYWLGVIKSPTTRAPLTLPLSARRQEELRYVLDSGRVPA